MIRTLLALLLTLFAAPALALDAGALPRFVGSVQGTGTPGLDGQPLFLFHAPPSFDGTPTLRVDRSVADGTSGEPGHTYKALWALTTTGRDNRGYEWAITGEVHNTTLGTTGAQQVAVNGTIWKHGEPGAEVGPSWALNGNCVDLSGIPDPSFSCVALELDVSGAAGTTDANRQRVGLHVSGGGGAGAHVGYGMLMSPTAGAVIDRGLALVSPEGGSYGIGLDTTAARFATAPIMLGAGQAVVLDGTPDGRFGRWLAYNGQFVGLYGPGGSPFQSYDDGLFATGRIREFAPRVPATSTSPCEPGERAWDEAYEYRCVAPNRWKRAALSDW